jgi:hypothetical protein
VSAILSGFHKESPFFNDDALGKLSSFIDLIDFLFVMASSKLVSMRSQPFIDYSHF